MTTTDRPLRADPTAERTRGHQRAWGWYDWANSAYVTTVTTVLFAPYLIAIAREAAVDNRIDVLGLSVAPGALPSYIITFSTLLSAVILAGLRWARIGLNVDGTWRYLQTAPELAGCVDIRRSYASVPPAVLVQADELVEWPPRGAVPVPADDWYERTGAGITYGPSFQGLHAVWHRDDVVFTEVRLPEDAAADATRYGVPPRGLVFHWLTNTRTSSSVDPGEM